VNPIGKTSRRQYETILARIAATREWRERLEFEGAVPLKGTPAEFAVLIRAQGEKWGKLIRTSGIKPE
jgi:tripartite-type tricarboxylate transporter receptor subunit TctC